MTPSLVYFSGPPGVGKSTLVAHLTDGLYRVTQDKPFAHDWLFAPAVPSDLPVGVELGRRREAFSGTDALGMSVSPRACEWLKTIPVDLVLGEGDRLATMKFLGAAAQAGYSVTLVNLTASPGALKLRRERRGSNQNAQWMKGRETKAANLAEAAHRAGVRVVTVNTNVMRAPDIALMLRAQVPELRSLRPGVRA